MDKKIFGYIYVSYNLGMVISNNFNKSINYVHVIKQKFNQHREG